MSGKWLDLLKEIAPRVMRAAVLREAFDGAQRRPGSNQSTRGRGRALPRPRGPCRTLASNDPQRDRGKADRPEIGLQRRIKIGSIVLKSGAATSHRPPLHSRPSAPCSAPAAFVAEADDGLGPIRSLVGDRPLGRIAISVCRVVGMRDRPNNESARARVVQMAPAISGPRAASRSARHSASAAAHGRKLQRRQIDPPSRNPGTRPVMTTTAGAAETGDDRSSELLLPHIEGAGYSAQAPAILSG
jgi:hypothetical protein